MDEKDLARQVRAVDDSPEDPDPWRALARDLDRSGRPTPAVNPALLDSFLAAWRVVPDARELERFFQHFTHLLPARHEIAIPFWLTGCWAEAADPARAPYHRESGLPTAVTRLDGHAILWLVPEGRLRVHHALTGQEIFRIRGGYVHPTFAASLHPPEQEGELGTLDHELLGHALRATGELLPALPAPGARPLPLSRLLGRRAAHGLTAEDREPLPPPPLPGEHPAIETAPRLSGAPPPIRPRGAPVSPNPTPRRGLVQWLKDLLES